MRYVFRAELRRRCLAWLAMGALVGLVAGAVIAAAAGASRTATVYDRFLETENAFDVGVSLLCLAPGQEGGGRGGRESGAPPSPEESARCLERIRSLPGVTDATSLTQITQLLATTDNRSVQPDGSDPCYSGPGLALLGADPDGRLGTELNRFKLVEGRQARPAAADEVVVSVEMARRLDVHPGDELVARVGIPCEADPGSVRPRRLEVVGVGAAPYLVRPASGEYTNLVLGTPALLREVSEEIADTRRVAVVTLDDGEGGVEAFLEEARGIGVPVDEGVQDQAVHADAMQRGIRPQAVALALVAVLAGLAALLVLGSVLVRQARVDAADDPRLAVLGCTRSQRVLQAAVRGGCIALVTVVIAGVTAFLLSGSLPTGTAGLVEPNPGRTFDAGVLLPGALITAVAVIGCGLLGSVRKRGSGAPLATGERGFRRPSRTAGWLAGMGAPPTAVSGVRMALEPGGGSASIPVRSSLLGVLAGLTFLVAAITFSASLGHLLTTPRLVGWNWDVGVPFSEEGSTGAEGAPIAPEAVLDAAAAEPRVAAYAPGTFFAFVGGGLGVGPEETTVALLAFGNGGVEPTVLDGRAPRAPDEILLGTETLEATGLDIGDQVDLAATDEGFNYAGPPSGESAPFEIVGTGVIPVSGGEARLGRGAATTLPGIRRLFPEAAVEVLWLRFEPDADPRSTVGAIAGSLGLPPPGPEDSFGLSDFDDQLVDVRGVDALPLVLAGLVGLMAAGVLAHVVITGIQARRHDLAMLRTLGFVRRQVWATVAWQASVLTAMAVVVAVPLGVAGGRATWNAFADNLGVVPEPVVPVGVLLLTVAAVLVGANLVAAIPARRASRARLVDVLRAE